jgi:Asp-tRNA(Asn)/Glu-tRNA(Gln) amidotransferase A subunit family amidase
VGLPLFVSDGGLPMGLQLVGRVGDDARLLRTAAWLMDLVQSGQEIDEQKEIA